jgi:hypothetical protein
VGWPTISDYNAAFSNPARGLVPAALKSGSCRTGPMGGPLPISGGYALIYDLGLPEGARKAIRCFIDDDAAQRAITRDSLSRLAAALAGRPALRPHFVEAEWVEDCVAAGGQKVPALVMDWAEGRTLGAWLEAEHGRPGALEAMREAFAELMRTLEAGGVVHGDLQTGNVLVGRKGGLVLIDYDELRFPGRGGCPPSSKVHVHFQHPRWSASCDPALKDRFPAIALDLGLAAIAANPALFARHSNGENVLFKAGDYADPASSQAFADLSAMDGFAYAAELFAGLCRLEVDALPSLDEFRAEAFGSVSTPAARRAIEIAAAAGAARPGSPPRVAGGAAYVGAYPVLSALDYGALMRAVGRKVEVVGRIVQVKADGRTRHGDPYAFVNFGDWRRDGFKLTLWSEGLARLRSRPDEAWVGRWVSVTGLVDEPYHSPRWSTTQLSITVQDGSQLRFIDQAEAGHRLGLVPKDGGPPVPPRPAAAAPSRPSNADMLADLALRKAVPTTASGTGAAKAGPATTGGSQKPAPPFRRGRPSRKSPTLAILSILSWLGLLVLLLRTCV